MADTQHLVKVSPVKLYHLAGGVETLLFEDASATLTLHRPPRSRTGSVSPNGGKSAPVLPPRPGSASSSLPPPPSYDSLPTSSSSSEYLILDVALASSNDVVLSLPISLADASNSIVAVPPSSYIIPNLAGVDPSSLSSARSEKHRESGFIKLALPSGTHAASIDPETRELFEASLFGLYRGGNVESTTPQPSQLYIVDESTGAVLGQLAGGSAHLEEDSSLTSGRIDGEEPVVIDSLGSPTPGGSGGGINYSVRPISSYQPAANPQGSQIVTAANFLSRGIIVGSQLLSKTFESSAGRYTSSRPASTSPMVFSAGAKSSIAKGNQLTQTATVYSGKAASIVGNIAGKVGDKIGKTVGIQSQPGGPQPKGWRGTLASTLTAVNTVADHLEAGGKTLIDSGGRSASSVVHHRYGSEAKEVADNLGGSVKHAALVYIDARGVGRKALLKSVGKSALRAKMADGSELYLSNENGELHQIEASAMQAQNATPLSIEGGKSASAFGGFGSGSGTNAPLYPGAGATTQGVTKGFGGKQKTG